VICVTHSCPLSVCRDDGANERKARVRRRIVTVLFVGAAMVGGVSAPALAGHHVGSCLPIRVQDGRWFMAKLAVHMTRTATDISA